MFETDRTETPSPVNTLGVKGVGEAGTIGATPAIGNAVIDALRPLGVTFINLPYTPMRVWQAIQDAQGTGEGPRATEQGRELDEHGAAARASGRRRRKEGSVIPPEFEYAAPETLEEAIRLLSEGGEDAKVLAGGHSLIPLMKLRLAAPALLVDLRRVQGLHGVQREDGEFRIGAMTTHRTVEFTSELGLAARAAGTIADPQVRNRGTLGGTLAHGDPASDMPAVLLAAEGSVTARGPGGQRTIAAADLFEDYLTTSLAPDEIVTEVRIPALDGYGFSYQKFNRRAEDWAMVAVSALVSKAADGTCEDVRIALGNMGSVPLRATAAEAALRGRALDAQSIAAAAEQAPDGTDPPEDLNATADYKRHLARVLCRRALEEAVAAATK